MATNTAKWPYVVVPGFENVSDYWPDLKRQRIIIAPVGVGMDRKSGKIMVGWDHVVQSAGMIFATRYHERVLRRWVGSFVPHILGESGTPSVIQRFFWAIATALDLWEPRYKIERVRVNRRNPEAIEPGNVNSDLLTSAEELRQGTLTTRPEGIYMPRGHLGNFAPETRRAMGLIGRMGGDWVQETST